MSNSPNTPGVHALTAKQRDYAAHDTWWAAINGDAHFNLTTRNQSAAAYAKGREEERASREPADASVGGQTLLQNLHNELYRAQRTESVEVQLECIGIARILLARYRDSLAAIDARGQECWCNGSRACGLPCHPDAPREEAPAASAQPACTCCGCGGCKSCLGKRNRCAKHSPQPAAPEPDDTPLETGEADAR